MPATPDALNHLRNSTIASFFFLLLLIATLSTYAGVYATAPDTGTLEDAKRRNIINGIGMVSMMAESAALVVCILTTFGLSMHNIPAPQ